MILQVTCCELKVQESVGILPFNTKDWLGGWANSAGNDFYQVRNAAFSGMRAIYNSNVEDR